jgi:hypothetical protein
MPGPGSNFFKLLIVLNWLNLVLLLHIRVFNTYLQHTNLLVLTFE